jgi:hypothetical protein
MLVETFEVTETGADGKPECDKEALAIIEKLGLKGQQTLIAPNQEGARCPYRKMTAEEFFVYSILCPQKTELTNYSDESIPLRVLQVAAHAVTLEKFTTLEVWHPENADIKDPVLVGIVGKYSDREHFILARWGATLDSLETLKALACKVKKDIILAGINTAIEAAKAELSAVSAMSDYAILKVKEPEYRGINRMW